MLGPTGVVLRLSIMNPLNPCVGILCIFDVVGDSARDLSSPGGLRKFGEGQLLVIVGNPAASQFPKKKGVTVLESVSLLVGKSFSVSVALDDDFDSVSLSTVIRRSGVSDAVGAAAIDPSDRQTT